MKVFGFAKAPPPTMCFVLRKNICDMTSFVGIALNYGYHYYTGVSLKDSITTCHPYLVTEYDGRAKNILEFILFLFETRSTNGMS